MLWCDSPSLCTAILTMLQVTVKSWEAGSLTHRVPDHHWWLGIVVTEIERHFHARIPAPNNEDALPTVTLPRLVVAGMHDVALKIMEALKLRHDLLSILPGGHHEPLADILDLKRAQSVPPWDDSPHPPVAENVVILCGEGCLIEVGVDIKAARIGFKVADELVLGWVLGEVLGEGKARELAELLREVELEPVISPVLPVRGNAVGSLQDNERDTLLFKASPHSQATRACPNYYRPVHPDASFREEAFLVIEVPKRIVWRSKAGAIVHLGMEQAGYICITEQIITFRPTGLLKCLGIEGFEKERGVWECGGETIGYT